MGRKGLLRPLLFPLLPPPESETPNSVPADDEPPLLVGVLAPLLLLVVLLLLLLLRLLPVPPLPLFPLLLLLFVLLVPLFPLPPPLRADVELELELAVALLEVALLEALSPCVPSRGLELLQPTSEPAEERLFTPSEFNM